MAIPTQFSVANTNIAPIANPPLAKDLPKVIEAEEHSLVDGASIIPSLSSVGVSAPQELTAETAVVIANPSAKTAQSKLSVDAPVEKTAESKAAVDAPVEKTAQTKTTNPNPSVLTPKTGTLTVPPFPLNHARILYDNKLQSYSSVTQNNTGIPLNALTPNTWQRWEFTVSGEDALWSVTLNSESSFDTVCLGAHNLADIGATVQINYDPEPIGGYNPFGPVVTPINNAAIMVHLASPVNAIRIQVQVIGGNGSGYIGYISGGLALQMQRPFFNGHRPFTDGDVTEYYANRTESGERIGRQIRRKGFETSFEWSNLDDGWYRQYIPEFKEFAKRVPVFLAWNLLEYPDDVAFGDITEDFGASMQNGTATKRSGLSFTIAGVG